ncbi:hypothetical protein EVAR_97768_1 [Eumeta japonica]|uniref:Uncharacterized protein n=1 Tax=Eumeta variegata TaxID=151549 RepID=A0A4C1Y3X3_EUMVA|nr:hypothetical protein EVAR_97768_1 [Eumeta japonica]
MSMTLPQVCIVASMFSERQTRRFYAIMRKLLLPRWSANTVVPTAFFAKWRIGASPDDGVLDAAAMQSGRLGLRHRIVISCFSLFATSPGLRSRDGYETTKF